MSQIPPRQGDDRLEFHEAMRDFRKMFPTLEIEVIEAVLRANNGAVDDTIDQLLVMSLDREENAYAETLPKRIGDLETASPRVNVSPQATAAIAASSPAGSARTSSASLPSYWLVDVDEDSAQAQAPYNEKTQRLSSPRPPDMAACAKKVYRPPLVGVLPRDFLRVSSSADPWEEPAVTGHRPSSRASYSVRRSTVNYDYRQLLEEKQPHEGPPPSYAVAVGRRNSERVSSKTERPHYRAPQHAYLGVFRTTIPHPPSPRRSSDRFAVRADALQDAIAENKWKRRVAKDPELAQYLEDERIALMLQNQEFMRQLRNDRDFLAALDRDAAEARIRQSPRKSSSSQSKSQRDHSQSQLQNQSSPRSAAGGACNEDLTDPVMGEPFPADPFPYTKTIPKPEDVVERSFQEKLSLMGRASKRKFATMARRFIRKSKGSKGVLDNHEARTHVLLLDSDGESGGEQSADANAGYNQPSDAEYNIGHGTDLKQGRFF